MLKPLARKNLILSGAFGAMMCAGVSASTAADAPSNFSPANSIPPDLSPPGVSWLAQGTDFKQVPGAPPMVANDPSRPHVGNAARGNGDSSFRFAEVNNPNLTDFARAGLQKVNNQILGGRAMFSREARCWPTGVPTYDLDQAEPVYFIQTAKEVVMIWQMDHQVRHIYLDVPHSRDVKPSWYGESVGHYEGDTLVVDTIGQNTETFVDNYRTPHSTALHVTERFHLINSGKNLRADIVIEDPATFKQPSAVYQTWRRMDRAPC